MKIFGIEINRAKTASDVVKVVPKTIETQPTIPLKSSFPKQELGDSGTRMMSGIITEDYNPQLQGIQGVKIFDQMRKSDGTVRAAVLACTLPIRRATWYVKSASEDPKDKEIADMVKNALFDWIEDMTFDDVVRQALLMIPFGVMPFEKVYGVKTDGGKSWVTLKKLAPRLPTSIQQWELSDKTFGIQQIRQDGVLAQIPGSKLLIFVNEREGDNWWGTSMLRAAYKHWYYKDGFYKIDAVAFERQGLGVPKIKMPQGYTVSDEQKATQAMQNLRANEKAYLLLPPGYDAEFMDMGSSTTRDPEKSINHHNKQILQSVLAQFLELGQTSSGSGSHALSADHSDLFLKGVEAVAGNLASTISKDLIEELVNLNFNDVSKYPTLEYSGISKDDVTGITAAYNTLLGAGAIDKIDADQQYFRSLLGLPEIIQDDLDAIETDAVDGGIEETEPPADGAPAADAPIDPTKPKPDAKDAKKVDKAAADTKKKASHRHSHTHHTLKRKFDDGSGYMTWRPLTFAEQKVSFSNIEKTITELEDAFGTAATQAMKDAKDAFMVKLHKAITEGDTKAIQDLEIKFVADYKAILKDTMKKAYEYGKSNVSTEIGVAVPANNAASLAEIDLLADTVANKAASDIEARAKTAVANALKQNLSPLQTSGAVDAALDDLIDQSVINAKGLVVSQSINTGRNDVFERNGDIVYGLQRSEVLDYATCNFCLSMDGRVVDKEDSWAQTDTFHNNCRGIWVAILKDEQDPPEIGGIPDNLDEYYTGVPNGLVQPPRPMTLPGTLADDYYKAQKAKK